MCAYHPYIDKIFSTHQLKCIVSIMYNLYANSAKIRYFIEKTKISKLSKIPDFMVKSCGKTKPNSKKKIENFNMCLMGAYHIKN